MVWIKAIKVRFVPFVNVKVVNQIVTSTLYRAKMESISKWLKRRGASPRVPDRLFSSDLYSYSDLGDVKTVIAPEKGE